MAATASATRNPAGPATPHAHLLSASLSAETLLFMVLKHAMMETSQTVTAAVTLAKLRKDMNAITFALLQNVV